MLTFSFYYRRISCFPKDRLSILQINITVCVVNIKQIIYKKKLTWLIGVTSFAWKVIWQTLQVAESPSRGPLASQREDLQPFSHKIWNLSRLPLDAPERANFMYRQDLHKRLLIGSGTYCILNEKHDGNVPQPSHKPGACIS